MRAELDQLWTVERPRVTQEVADAAAQGDRSENAEYIYGKRRLREIDRRVRFLSKRLGRDHAALSAGALVTTSGEVVGEHEGYARYTVGQRKGLGGGRALPLFVLGSRPAPIPACSPAVCRTATRWPRKSRPVTLRSMPRPQIRR